MSTPSERMNAKRIAQGLEPLPKLSLPPRERYVFNLQDFISKLHTLAPYTHPWNSLQGLEHLVTICKESGFQGTTEEIHKTFNDLYTSSINWV